MTSVLILHIKEGVKESPTLRYVIFKAGMLVSAVIGITCFSGILDLNFAASLRLKLSEIQDEDTQPDQNALSDDELSQ